MVCGRGTELEEPEFVKCKTSSVAGCGLDRSTTMSTLFEGRDRVCPPDVHSACAVLLMIFGKLCACAGRQAAAKWVAAASVPARKITDVVNVRIRSEGDRQYSCPPPPFSSVDGYAENQRTGLTRTNVGQRA